jgi:hypothetical protein
VPHTSLSFCLQYQISALQNSWRHLRELIKCFGEYYNSASCCIQTFFTLNFTVFNATFCTSVLN